MLFQHRTIDAHNRKTDDVKLCDVFKNVDYCHCKNENAFAKFIENLKTLSPENELLASGK